MDVRSYIKKFLFFFNGGHHAFIGPLERNNSKSDI